ncbi:MAG TPA: hypothetical protein VJ044_07300, partial [Candidatus Hodarchaeales archaeon]|nr:hypothetical protein [Candidatus Hodarchaeales archaeon]
MLSAFCVVRGTERLIDVCRSFCTLHDYTVQQIGEVTCLHEECIRERIRQSNVEKVALFKKRARSGWPVAFVPEIMAQRIAPSRLKPLGSPFTRWSLKKLRAHFLSVKGMRKINVESLRTVLQSPFICRRTKTWKESMDRHPVLKRTDRSIDKPIPRQS